MTSRVSRWRNAAQAAQAAVDALREAWGEGDATALEKANSDFSSAVSDLKALRGEYEKWQDNLPESLSTSVVADKLEEVVNMDFSKYDGGIDDLPESDFDPDDRAEDIDFDGLNNFVDEVKAADLPLGFGRD